MIHWAMKYDKCIACHTTNKPHKAKGLCTTCYYKQYKRRIPPNRLTELDRLLEEAKDQGRYDVIDALDNLLYEYGGSCRLNDTTISFTWQGKTLEATLE